MEHSAVKIHNPYEVIAPPSEPEPVNKKKQQQPQQAKKQKPKKTDSADSNSNSNGHTENNSNNNGNDDHRDASPMKGGGRPKQNNQQQQPKPSEPGIPDGAWKTSQKRTNVRKEKKSVNLDTALSELEQQILALHHPVQRMGIIRQWRLYLEETNPTTKYLDSEGNTLTFTEVFLQSRALEEIVQSALEHPFLDDLHLQLLFSACLMGDFAFLRRLLDGLRLISVVFKEIHTNVPQRLVDKLCTAIGLLKVNPQKKKDRSDAIKKIDAQIAYIIGRLKGGSGAGGTAGVEDKTTRTSELLKLSIEKQKLLSESSNVANNGYAGVDIQELMDDVVDEINTLVTFGKLEREAALDKIKEFEQNKKQLLKGKDSSVTAVIEMSEKFDQEEAALNEKKKQLEDEIEKVKVAISKIHQKRRDHRMEYGKVMTEYQDWLNGYQGETETVKSAFQYAETALSKRQQARDFAVALSGDIQDILAGRSTANETQKNEAARELLQLLDSHMGNLKENVELITRRIKFCNGKLAFMKEELQEAVDLGMTDIAKDLGAGLGKLESMQHEAKFQLDNIWNDVDNIRKILDSSDDTAQKTNDTAMSLISQRTRANLEDLLRLKDTTKV